MSRSKLSRKSGCTVLATRREELIKVALVKATKHKANPQLTRVVWRTETMVLPDYKVAITKQSKYC